MEYQLTAEGAIREVFAEIRFFTGFIMRYSRDGTSDEFLEKERKHLKKWEKKIGKKKCSPTCRPRFPICDQWEEINDAEGSLGRRKRNE